jgi:hypothetical protein
MKTSEILTKAKRVIQDPKKWTKGAMAKSNHGYGVTPDHPAAETFCSLGALVVGGGRAEFSDPGYKYLAQAINGANVANYNDAPIRTHADVMNMFSVAIEAAKADETPTLEATHQAAQKALADAKAVADAAKAAYEADKRSTVDATRKVKMLAELKTLISQIEADSSSFKFQDDSESNPKYRYRSIYGSNSVNVTFNVPESK